MLKLFKAKDIWYTVGSVKIALLENSKRFNYRWHWLNLTFINKKGKIKWIQSEKCHIRHLTCLIRHVVLRYGYKVDMKIVSSLKVFSYSLTFL